MKKAYTLRINNYHVKNRINTLFLYIGVYKNCIKLLVLLQKIDNDAEINTRSESGMSIRSYIVKNIIRQTDYRFLHKDGE